MPDNLRPVEDDLAREAMRSAPAMSPEDHARGRAALLSRIDADSFDAKGTFAAYSGTSVLFAPKRKRGRWLAAAAALVLVVGGGLVAPSLVSDPPAGPVESVRFGSASAAAAEVLNQAALKTGDVELKAGQFLYVREDGTSGGASRTVNDRVTYWYSQPQLTETWIPADRRGEWLYRRTTSGERTFLVGGPADVPADEPCCGKDGEWKTTGGPRFGRDLPASFANPTPEYLALLPRDPKALYEKLYREDSGGNSSSFLSRVDQGLATGMIPADLRAAVFKALTHLADLEVTDQVADLNGRKGTALGITVENTSHQIIIDAANGDYLGSRDVLVKAWSGMAAGTVLGSSSVTTKVVGGLGATG